MKKIWKLMIIVFIFIGNTSNIHADEDIQLETKYIYAVDMESGMELYNTKADERMYPASMTKVATAIVAIEMIEDMQATVTITKEDLDTIFETQASAAYLQIGEVVTYEDLLYGVIMPSGADACRALAFNLSGSIEAFVDEMNAYVKKIGLKDTHFVNPTGIHDDNHYSTLKDIAKLTEVAMENEVFYELFTSYGYTTSNGIHSWANSAKAFASAAGVPTDRIIGCKSGYTDEAQSCLVSLAKVNGREVMVVVGHTLADKISSPATRQTNQILDDIEENYGYQEIFKKDQEIIEVPVLYAKDISRLKVQMVHDVELYLPNDIKEEDLKIDLEFEDIIPNVEIDDPIGKLKISYQNIELYEEIFNSDVKIEKDFFAYLQYGIFNEYRYITIGAILVSIYLAIHSYKPK